MDSSKSVLKIQTIIRTSITRQFSVQIQTLRQKFRDLDIEVDGGVGQATIQSCAEVYSYECSLAVKY